MFGPHPAASLAGELPVVEVSRSAATVHLEGKTSVVSDFVARLLDDMERAQAFELQKGVASPGYGAENHSDRATAPLLISGGAMTQEFEDEDLRGAVFWGVDLREATFRDVDFTGTRTHHVLLRDVEFDGVVERLVVNGVDVTDYVNTHDPWQPLRGMLQPQTAAEVRITWDAIGQAWDATIAEAAGLTPEQRRASVNGEWSFVETLRHLVFVTDKWVIVPNSGGPFEPIGMPNRGSADGDWPGIDRGATPDEHDVVGVRRRQGATIRRMLETLDDEALRGDVEVLENGTESVLHCWHTLFEEEFEHRRYALRDLAEL